MTFEEMMRFKASQAENEYFRKRANTFSVLNWPRRFRGDNRRRLPWRAPLGEGGARHAEGGCSKTFADLD